MENAFVTVATFSYPHEMFVTKEKLESEGIKCFILNENIITADPFLSNAVGGVKLQVMKQDTEKALEIIKIVNEGIIDVDIDEDDIKLKEENFKREKKLRNGWLIVIIAFVVLFIISVFL